jgi:signal transduction histidine kinase
VSLPQLAELSLPETVTRAVRAHERRTGSRVNFELAPLPEQAALPVKITIYRLLQEALNNAYRHAGGTDQKVRVLVQGDLLVINVSDRGPGFEPKPASVLNGHLGLAGMRERIESLGGLFQVESAPGKGTRVSASLSLNAGEENHER